MWYFAKHGTTYKRVLHCLKLYLCAWQKNTLLKWIVFTFCWLNSFWEVPLCQTKQFTRETWKTTSQLNGKSSFGTITTDYLPNQSYSKWQNIYFLPIFFLKEQNVKKMHKLFTIFCTKYHMSSWAYINYQCKSNNLYPVSHRRASHFFYCGVIIFDPITVDPVESAP